MQNKLIQFKHFINVSRHNLNIHVRNYWYKYIMILFAFGIIYLKDLNIVFELKNPNKNYFISEKEKIEKKLISQEEKLIIEDFPEKKKKRIKSDVDYINTYKSIARAEMKKYKIPASIILAQGILESNSGKSKLATDCNNHFGIKCFSRKCTKNHCMNFSDDSHKDFFKKYKSAKASYRDHSIFLQKKRYRHLLDLELKDYKAWSHGLKKAGYATDKKYAFKLISIIEKYKLYKFDE